MVSGWHMMRIAIDSIVGNQDMPIATLARKCRAVANATIIEAWTQVNVGSEEGRQVPMMRDRSSGSKESSGAEAGTGRMSLAAGGTLAPQERARRRQRSSKRQGAKANKK